MSSTETPVVFDKTEGLVRPPLGPTDENDRRRGRIAIGIALLFLMAIVVTFEFSEEKITRIDYEWAAEFPDTQYAPPAELSPREREVCYNRYWSKGIDICTLIIVTVNITASYSNYTQGNDTSAATTTTFYAPYETWTIGPEEVNPLENCTLAGFDKYMEYGHVHNNTIDAVALYLCHDDSAITSVDNYTVDASEVKRYEIEGNIMGVLWK